jgi:hypothetical protein
MSFLVVRGRLSFREPRQPNTGKRSSSPNACPELTTIELLHLSCLLVTLTGLLFVSREILILQSDLGMEGCLEPYLIASSPTTHPTSK